MAYEHVHKSFGQSSSKKKHSPIVPPLIEQQTPADSQLSPKVKLSRIPSKDEREAIKRKIFETLDRTGENQAMRSGLYNLSASDQKTPDSASTIGTPIQAKLTIGEPGDKYEQEADKVASQVVNLLNAPVAQQSAQNLQREETSTDDELQMKPMVQLQSGEGGMTATPEVETSIQQARGGGQTLADNIREPMEQAFRADFSGVKVHTDSQADQLNQSIQARAFTTGQDVFFRQGEYQPGSREGQELIAHELTHVVQQNENHLSKSCLLQTFHLSSISQPTIQGVFANNSSLNSHFQKHVINQKDAGGAYANEADYESAADAIVANASSLSKPRGGGGMYYFNQTTNQFVATNPAGRVLTMFVPKKTIDYYNDQV